MPITLDSQNKLQTYFVRITSFIGLLLGLLYFRPTPIYLLGTLEESEIAYWALAVFVLSLILLIIPLSYAGWKKIVLVFILLLLLVLNFVVVIQYFEFFSDVTIGPNSFQQARLSWVNLIPHIIFIVVVFITLYFLMRNKKETKVNQLNSD